MKVDLFDFELPANRIATRPVTPRDAARLLVVGDAAGNNGFGDCAVRDLPTLLRAGDVIVFNNTRVIPARLLGTRGQAQIEATLHKRAAEDAWWVFARPAKRLRIGETFQIAPDFSAVVEAKQETGEVLLRFNHAGAALFEKLHQYGAMPLPPYIKREERQVDKRDNSDYQTVYARHEGAVAAPTAGLHFTDALLAQLDAAGIQRVEVTLHVGAGTFLPVKVDDTREHRMHSEDIIVTEEQAERINAAKAAGGRVIAVGTTALRVLESVTDEAGKVQPFSGETDIFITPGYCFRIVDVMMTNFHLPRSTLFMLVSAFSGLEKMQAAYKHAIDNGYRFYSYGDACLLERAQP